MCAESYSLLTQSYTLITHSHIHTCMCAHTESYSWSHMSESYMFKSLTYTDTHTGMHTHGRVIRITQSYTCVHVCSHRIIHAVSHRHTQRYTRSLTYTHKQRHAGDGGEIFSKSFSCTLASPHLSPRDPSLLPSPWSPALVSSAGTQALALSGRPHSTWCGDSTRR